MGVTHVVKQGECLSSIAARYGFSDPGLIYDHPNNADFKKRRRDPNVIYPGDPLFIPDRDDKEVECAAGKVHRFKVKLPTRLIRIELEDHDGKALAGVEYTLAVGGEERSGKTDGGGVLEQKVPADATDGVITLPKYGVRWAVQIGHLDPVHDDDADEAILSGVQARLNNLGYHAGAVDGVLGPKTRAALARFQREALGRDEPDGAADQETRDALRERHGC